MRQGTLRSLILLVLISLFSAEIALTGFNSFRHRFAQIQDDGFLTETFHVEGLPLQMKVRQVPGDGNCLFHSISTCLEHARTSNHSSLDLEYLLPKSATLRKMAVDYLLKDLNRSLYLEEGETVPVNELLTVVATQYNMTVEGYLSHMQLPSVWGGGPEIVAISNCLRQPIHVYELAGEGSRFCFRRMACFGSPLFDKKCKPIHILSADARFPQLFPGQQLANGNHFLSLFPCDATDSSLRHGDAKRHWFGGVGKRLKKYFSKKLSASDDENSSVVTPSEESEDLLLNEAISTHTVPEENIKQDVT